MTLNELEKTILKTLAYFDVHEYPLTLLEVHQWLYQPDREYLIIQVLETLEKLAKERRIGLLNGYYFLPNREDLVRQRLSRYVIATQKYKRALRIANWLRLVPGIRAVAIANTLAISNAGANSDIDFFIITARHRIWVARGITTITLKLLNLRPRPKNKSNKIDVTFWISEASLDISGLRLDNDDVYFHYWLAQLMPVYNVNDTWARFRKNNQWLEKFLPHAISAELIWRRVVKPTNFWRRLAEFFTTSLDEKLYRAMQHKIMNPKIKAMMNQDTRVVVNDSVLKFHTHDGRPEFRDKWQAKLKVLNLV